MGGNVDNRCTQCGGQSFLPHDMDAWICSACGWQRPTRAFMCKAEGCEDVVVGFGDHCRKHQAKTTDAAALGD